MIYIALFIAALISLSTTFVLCAVLASREQAMSDDDAAMRRIQAAQTLHNPPPRP